MSHHIIYRFVCPEDPPEKILWALTSEEGAKQFRDIREYDIYTADRETGKIEARYHSMKFPVHVKFEEVAYHKNDAGLKVSVLQFCVHSPPLDIEGAWEVREDSTVILTQKLRRSAWWAPPGAVRRAMSRRIARAVEDLGGIQGERLQ